MWYVMQVMSGREEQTILIMEGSLSCGIFRKCFVPVRRMKKKYQGRWREITEKIFPGYVFLVSDEPQLLYSELKQIPALTKLLGSCEEYFTPLPEKDIHMLEKFQSGMVDGASLEIGISKIAVEEGKRIRILSGPLVNLEGQIRKMNLHKRIAEVEMEFMGNQTVIHLGIDIMEKIGEKI